MRLLENLRYLAPYEIVFGVFLLLAFLVLSFIEYQKAGWDSHSTRRRRLARLGALAAFAVGVATFGLDMLGRQAAAREKIEDTNQMITEIRQLLGRFDNVIASFEIRVTATHPQLIAYSDFLRQQRRCFVQVPSGHVQQDCFPSSDRWPVAFAALGATDIRLDFFKSSPSWEQYLAREGGLRPDLSLRAGAELGDHLKLEYHPEQRSFLLSGLMIQLEVSKGKRSGLIQSSSDLESARMFVSFTNFEAGVRDLQEAREAMTVESLFLHFPGAPDVECALSKQDLKRIAGGEGQPFYVYDIRGVAPEATNGTLVRPIGACTGK